MKIYKTVIYTVNAITSFVIFISEFLLNHLYPRPTFAKARLPGLYKLGYTWQERGKSSLKVGDKVLTQKSLKRKWQMLPVLWVLLPGTPAPLSNK